MLWDDDGMIALDSGRQMTVRDVIVGIDMPGKTIFVGSVSVAVANSTKVGQHCRTRR